MTNKKKFKISIRISFLYKNPPKFAFLNEKCYNM